MNQPTNELGTRGERSDSADSSKQRLEAAIPAIRELSGKLAGLSLGRQVAVLAVWPFLEQVLNFLVGFVDLAIAGHLGKQAVSATNAIGVGVYVEWLISLIQSAVGIGSAAIIARAIGGRHRRVANAALGQSMLLAAVVGCGMGVGIYLAAGWIAGFTRLTGESYELCMTYLRVVSLSAPATAVLLVGAACLRGAGDTRTPFWVLVVVNVVNTALSIVFVKAPAPIGGHGVAGIAAGTVAAYGLGAVLVLVVLLRGWGDIRLHLHRLRPHRHTMVRIVRVGLPNFLEMFLGMWVANFLVMRVVGMLGQEYAWGAHLIAVRVEAVSYMPGFAMGIAAATLAGQYLGAGDPKRAREAMLLCWKAGVAIMGVMGLVFIFTPWALVRVATNQEAFLAVSPQLLRTAGFVQVFFATAIVFGQGMRGAGDTRTTMFMTALSTYGVRLPLAYLFGITFGWGLRGVWLALCGELAFRGCLFGARFLHGGWARARV